MEDFGKSQPIQDEGPPSQRIQDTHSKFYTFDEVIVHNTHASLWVIINGVIQDLTDLVKSRLDSPIIKYLCAFGGKDLSSYFDEYGFPRTSMSPFTGRQVAIFPPAVVKRDDNDKFWWEDSTLQSGRLTRQERPIRIINTLTAQTHRMTVCEEDTIYDIQLKYRNRYNFHAGSYVWRKWKINANTTGRLFLDKTLTQNGIVPSKYDAESPPSLWLFFLDDFTVD